MIDLESRLRDALTAVERGEPDVDELWARYPRYASRSQPARARFERWRHVAPFAVAALVAVAVTPVVWMSVRSHHSSAPGVSTRPTQKVTAPVEPPNRDSGRIEREMRAAFPPTYPAHRVPLAVFGRPAAHDLLVWYSQPKRAFCMLEESKPGHSATGSGSCLYSDWAAGLPSGPLLGGPTFRQRAGQTSYGWVAGAVGRYTTQVVVTARDGTAVPATLVRTAGQPERFFVCDLDGFSADQLGMVTFTGYDAKGRVTESGSPYDWTHATELPTGPRAFLHRQVFR